MKEPATHALRILSFGLFSLLVVASCSNKHLVSIAVTPADPSVSTIGQTMQFQAIGTTNHPNAGPGNAHELGYVVFEQRERGGDR